MSTEVYGNNFYIADTADVTDTRYSWNTGSAWVSTEVNRPYRVRDVTITNDDPAITITYRLNLASDATSFTLKAGETANHRVISDALWVDAASGTPAFRAWGLG